MSEYYTYSYSNSRSDTYCDLHIPLFDISSWN